jgi:hypothetical protein
VSVERAQETVTGHHLDVPANLGALTRACDGVHDQVAPAVQEEVVNRELVFAEFHVGSLSRRVLQSKNNRIDGRSKPFWQSILVQLVNLR